MKIAVDIDGVLGDTLKVTVDYLDKIYDIKIKEEDITQYDFHELIEMDEEEYKKMFLNYRLYLTEPIVFGSVEGMNELKKRGNEITLITSRDASLQDVTLNWLKKNKFPFDRIIFSGNKPKKEIAEIYGFDVFIEDCYETCLDLKSVVPTVIILDAPYNKGNHLGIIRAQSWEQILDKIRKY
jgi:uncharacterized HAD superfamily protein